MDIKKFITFQGDTSFIREVNKNRERGIGTSKIVAKYYHQESSKNQCPPKPDVAKKIAEFWCNNEIPSEFKDIMVRTINLTGK